jgi:DNA-binding MarR family transcriptional regulator
MQSKTVNTHSFSPGKVDQLQQLINDIGRYYSICDQYCSEQLGITASQGYTMLAMPETGSITMNELSLKMKLATSTMTRMADQLVQKSMIERQNDAEDRRVVRVYLTENGRRVKVQLKETMQNLYSQVLSGISAGEQDTVLGSLEMLNRSIVGVIKSCCGSDCCS